MLDDRTARLPGPPWARCQEDDFTDYVGKIRIDSLGVTKSSVLQSIAEITYLSIDLILNVSASFGASGSRSTYRKVYIRSHIDVFYGALWRAVLDR